MKTVHACQDWLIEQAKNNNYYITPLSQGQKQNHHPGMRRKRILKFLITKHMADCSEMNDTKHLS